MLSCKAPVSSAPDTSAAQPDTSTADTSAPDTGADTAAPEFAVPEHPYLLSFHTCMTEETSCGSPQNHTVQLAGSDDGVSWEVLDWFEPYPSSVPDVIVRDGILYVYALPEIRRIDLATNEALPMEMLTFLSEETVFHADPSMILDEDGRLVMFFLEGVDGSDPAACPDGPPCTLRIFSATEQEGSLGTVFTVDDGVRLALEITEDTPSRLSDPDIFTDDDGFVMLVSRGQIVQAYVAETLRGTYTALGKDDLTPNTGGVPAGAYIDGEYWLYVTVNEGHEMSSIHQTTTTDLSQELPADALSPLNVTPDFGESAMLGSPGFFAVQAP